MRSNNSLLVISRSARRRNPSPSTTRANREEYEVYDYEKRLPKRFMSEKSSTSVYTGAPNEFAEWIGYSVEELLGNPVENGTEPQSAAEPESDDSTDEESSGFFSRLLGR